MRLPQEDFCQALGVSPNLKYQAEGGPGIEKIMGVLLGSANATEDRDLFFLSQVLFWLLAAIDGPAKNFSLFLDAGAKYRLTPLYDIMSAYPLLASKQLEVKKIKMAMALRGKNNHYHWYELNRRYFLETAKLSNYSSHKAEIILDDMLDRIETVILEVSAKLPKEFPQQIAQTIFEGMRSIRDKLLKSGKDRN
jgi:serine/threonine-protein kinase HipA